MPFPKKGAGNPRLAALDDLEQHLVGASAKRQLSKKQMAALHAKKAGAPTPILDPNKQKKPDDE